MVKNKVVLEQERFLKEYSIPREKLERALEVTVKKLEERIDKHGASFFKTQTEKYQYTESPNNNWVCGMLTGTYLLAYELTGNPKFREVAEKQLVTYKERFEKRINVSDHDIGFIYAPSCVAAYKLWGQEKMRDLALQVADYYYHYSYSQKGGFIIRSANCVKEEWACRTMMDTLLNIPFLLWSGRERGKKEYIEAAVSQLKITEKYLIRDDASSFHHYQFDVETHKPVRGLTWQGYSDDSCWSRGHAWGVLGFPIAYSYLQEESLVELHRDVTYYMLNHMPKNLIPKYDLIFMEEKEQPNDSSAGLIAVCGMHEMCKHLPEDAPQKKVFESAGAQILEAIIDRCTGDFEPGCEGLVHQVTHTVPLGQGINECAVYGDYFYLEALMRYLNPSWKCYW